ncbi:MAG: NAD-binding protein [Anaerolineae bacterium]|nr:NAD-binding protein [Anaerolineae bacterium]
MNVVICGYSVFSWELAMQLRGQIGGRLYLVLADPERAREASLAGDIIAVEGELTDTQVLDQLGLDDCHSFVAGSREDKANVLSALYARNHGAQRVYARIFEPRLVPLLESLGIAPVLTSHTASASIALGILKPDVAALVDPTQGQFALDQLEVSEFPELVGLRLGNLQGENLHIIAVAQGGRTWLSYATTLAADAKLIIMYDNAIRRQLRQELRKVASQARKRM